MASPAQIAANQLNSRKSTGPRTPQGQAKSSMNALNALADQNIERLNAKLEVHEQNADAQAERTFARLGFDPSPEGEALRNYLIKCTNALFRGMANYRKYKAEASGRWDGASGVGRHGTQPERSDAPSEANFDETMSIVEARESTQVTANSGALPGLDNGAAQPGEDSTPEQGKAQGSGSASGNPIPRTPGSSDRACRGSLPAAVSKREKRRLRREKERRAVERMVRDKLSAGSFAPGEILMSALALPLAGDRGP